VAAPCFEPIDETPNVFDQCTGLVSMVSSNDEWTTNLQVGLARGTNQGWVISAFDVPAIDSWYPVQEAGDRVLNLLVQPDGSAGILGLSEWVDDDVRYTDLFTSDVLVINALDPVEVFTEEEWNEGVCGGRLVGDVEALVNNVEIVRFLFDVPWQFANAPET
jgi:hypothetical protein